MNNTTSSVENREQNTIDHENEVALLRDELAQAQARVEEMTQSHMALVSTVSHDLRSPLTAIVGYSNLLLEELGSAEPSLAPEEVVAWILSSANRLNMLIAAILDQALIERGALTLHFKQLDLVSLVKATVQSLGPTAETQIQATLPKGKAMVSVDQGRTGQMIYNLLDYALKSTPSQKLVGVSIQQVGEMWVFQVHDGGPALTAEEQALLFAPYYQTRRQRATSGVSSLGLSLVKAQAEAQGGWVEVESREGTGTTFRVHFPMLDRKGGVQQR